MRYKGEPEWNTPLVRLQIESEKHECEVYAKLETVNPTGVHKDRESAMVILEMQKQGFDQVVCSSSGNAAVSISAFAFMNGFKSHVFVGDIPEEKLQLIRVFRPEIHKAKGGYFEAVEAMLEFIAGRRVFNANAGYCGAKLEGNAFIGLEIARDLRPNYVICPTNNGTHFVGVGMGIRRYGSDAKMIAAVAPNSVVATSIAGFYGIEQPKIDNMVKETQGQIVEVSDEELILSARSMARQGILAEPASAASLAGLSHIKVEKGSVVCCTVTGSALKYPVLIQNILGIQ